jgi:hypothetical protein
MHRPEEPKTEKDSVKTYAYDEKDSVEGREKGSYEYPHQWHTHYCANNVGEHGKYEISIRHVAIRTRKAADSERGRLGGEVCGYMPICSWYNYDMRKLGRKYNLLWSGYIEYLIGRDRQIPMDNERTQVPGVRDRMMTTLPIWQELPLHLSQLPPFLLSQ